MAQHVKAYGAARVNFTGVTDRHRVPEHVAAFDVALQPAVTVYASPLKLLEYLVLAKAGKCFSDSPLPTQSYTIV